MKVTLGSYFLNEAKGSQDEFHISLEEEDGAKLYPDTWASMSFMEKYKKLRGTADILVMQWAIERGYRRAEDCIEQMKQIQKRDLS